MKITIQALHFEAGERLEAYIEKKVKRVAKFHDGATSAEVTLKVIKPETNANKDVAVKLLIPGRDFFVQQVADTFEEAIDRCVDNLERQVIKFKEKQ